MGRHRSTLRAELDIANCSPENQLSRTNTEESNDRASRRNSVEDVPRVPKRHSFEEVSHSAKQLSLREACTVAGGEDLIVGSVGTLATVIEGNEVAHTSTNLSESLAAELTSSIKESEGLKQIIAKLQAEVQQLQMQLAQAESFKDECERLKRQLAEAHCISAMPADHEEDSSGMMAQLDQPEQEPCSSAERVEEPAPITAYAHLRRRSAQELDQLRKERDALRDLMESSNGAGRGACKKCSKLKEELMISKAMVAELQDALKKPMFSSFFNVFNCGGSRPPATAPAEAQISVSSEDLNPERLTLENADGGKKGSAA